MRTTELLAPCPFCGQRNDGHTNAYGDGAPDPGDIAICIGCARVAVFAADLSLRPPTDSERAVFARDPRIQEVIAALHRQRRPAAN